MGPDMALEDLAARLQQGPAAARVESVDVSRLTPERDYDGFDVL
jgi:hypothetical protein